MVAGQGRGLAGPGVSRPPEAVGENDGRPSALRLDLQPRHAHGPESRAPACRSRYATGLGRARYVRAMSPRLPGISLADADGIVQTALEVGAERGFPPLAVAV